jgi:kynurenine formamidase
MSATTAAHVDLRRAIDISVHPASKRASFPYDSLPAYRRLSSADVADLFGPRQSHVVTAAVAAGAALVAQQCWRGGASSGHNSTLHQRVPAVLAGLLAAMWVWRTERRSRQLRHEVSERMNVSSSPHGPCIVHGRVVSITNSHAGTHADTVAHMMSPDAGLPHFRPEQYTGPCVVVQLTHSGPVDASVIDVVSRRAAAAGVNIAAAERVLFWFREPEGDGKPAADEWRDAFAHFTRSGTEALVSLCPQLLLVGTDSASVDHPSASPICEHAHGVLARRGVAILENLNLDRVGHGGSAASTGFFLGSLQTVFNPMAEFEDAIGCIAMFHPDVSC